MNALNECRGHTINSFFYYILFINVSFNKNKQFKINIIDEI
jgi:hypothetical protein